MVIDIDHSGLIELCDEVRMPFQQRVLFTSEQIGKIESNRIIFHPNHISLPQTFQEDYIAGGLIFERNKVTRVSSQYFS